VSYQCPKEDNRFDNEPCKTQWPFGHGLSYTTFEYSNLQASGGNGDNLKVSATVTNTGTYDGVDTVMFFTFDEFRSVTPEYKRLRAFQRVFLTAGSSTEVSLFVPAKDLAFVGPEDDTHYIFQPDMRFRVGVGALTDCRAEPDQPNCVVVEPKGDSKGYSPSCDEACMIWSMSGCSENVGLTMDKCKSMCTSIDDPAIGWGWNYVRCLESVDWEFYKAGSNDCWRMTSLCRDIFSTTPQDNMMAYPSMRRLESSMIQHAVGNSSAFSFLMYALSAVCVLWLSRKLTRPH
jgi:Fibronectin type III-like domain